MYSAFYFNIKNSHLLLLFRDAEGHGSSCLLNKVHAGSKARPALHVVCAVKFYNSHLKLLLQHITFPLIHSSNWKPRRKNLTAKCLLNTQNLSMKILEKWLINNLQGGTFFGKRTISLIFITILAVFLVL